MMLLIQMHHLFSEPVGVTGGPPHILDESLGIMPTVDLALGAEPVLVGATFGAAFFLIEVLGQGGDFNFLVEVGSERGE